jgi:3-methyl-2-oxobutanoate hydroxymethyltransferase
LQRELQKSLAFQLLGLVQVDLQMGKFLVWHDLLGIQDEFKPKFLKTYLNAKKDFLEALNEYAEETASISFPTLKHIFEDLSCVS